MRWVILLLGFWMLLPSAGLRAQDPGREVIGWVRVAVFQGTDGDPSLAGERSVEPGAESLKLLKSEERLRFLHYRKLGEETKPLFRSYENWAQPVAGSQEILCRFEVESRVSKEAKRLDVELWLNRKKILKTGVVLTVGKPVLVLGPEWRGGKLIFLVELAPEPTPAP